ncbi:hypothetical protein MNBD_PLANCTO02-3123 [hydrothermal vent metagenome]|uniref:Lipoprotein n=1 Tax=hydrothermal vent metagenome TaxID=652676 RepID=A0A3B1DXK2_9ZZZZ
MSRFVMSVIVVLIFFLAGCSGKSESQPNPKKPSTPNITQGLRQSESKDVIDKNRKPDVETQKGMTYEEMVAGRFADKKVKFNSEIKKILARDLEMYQRGPATEKEWDRVSEKLVRDWEKLVVSKPENDPKRKSMEERSFELNQILAARVGILLHRTQYSFSGLVVDKENKPIHNTEVVLEVDYTSDYYPEDTPREKFSFKFSDGRFNFRVKSIPHNVGISFKKEGYYTNEYQMSYLGKGEIKETQKEYDERIGFMALRNNMPPIVFRKRHNITIVLDKKGKVTNLNKFYGRLVRKSDDSGKVFDFSKSQPQIRKVKDIKNTKVLPKHCIAFTATPNKAGQFQDIYWDAKFKGVPTDKNHPVIEYKLIINDPDPTAGFYLIDPKKEGKYHKDQRMREAPKTGYVRELVFGSMQKYQIGSFYIKINGKYGKGKIDDNGYYHSSNEASCGVKIQMQPDGSRNLEIPDWFVISPYLNYKKPAN